MGSLCQKKKIDFGMDELIYAFMWSVNLKLGVRGAP